MSQGFGSRLTEGADDRMAHEQVASTLFTRRQVPAETGNDCAPARFLLLLFQLHLFKALGHSRTKKSTPCVLYLISPLESGLGSASAFFARLLGG